MNAISICVCPDIEILITNDYITSEEHKTKNLLK